ncbi:helix-turn-helix domain-containing protein [Achromobacter xylosoxidans]
MCASCATPCSAPTSCATRNWTRNCRARARAHAEFKDGALSFPVGTALGNAQRDFILATLAHHGGDKRLTAETLGVSLKTLYNRLDVYEKDVGGAWAVPARAAATGSLRPPPGRNIYRLVVNPAGAAGAASRAPARWAAWHDYCIVPGMRRPSGGPRCRRVSWDTRCKNCACASR